MSNTITADTDVDVPVSVAYNQWTQFEDLPRFMGGVESVEQIDDRRLHWKLSVGGVHREFDAAITDQEPDRLIAWSSTDGEIHAGRVEFKPNDDGSTHIELTIKWEPKDFVESAGAVLQIDDLQAKGDLKRFKELIEAQGHASGAWRGEL